MGSQRAGHYWATKHRHKVENISYLCNLNLYKVYVLKKLNSSVCICEYLMAAQGSSPSFCHTHLPPSVLIVFANHTWPWSSGAQEAARDGEEDSDLGPLNDPTSGCQDLFQWELPFASFWSRCGRGWYLWCRAPTAFCSDPAFCIISSTIWLLNLVELYGEEKKNKTRVKIIPVGYPDWR